MIRACEVKPYSYVRVESDWGLANDGSDAALWESAGDSTNHQLSSAARDAAVSEATR